MCVGVREYVGVSCASVCVRRPREDYVEGSRKGGAI